MIVRAPSEWPVVLAIGVCDREIVDARDPASHEALVIELPILVAVRPEPVARVVVPLVRKTHRDAVALTCPQLLDQSVVEFLAPLADQKLLYGLAPREELGTIAPAAVRRVGHGHPLRVSRVPGVLGQANFLRCGCRVEGRKRWARWFGR